VVVADVAAGVDDPQAAAMSPTTTTAPNAVIDRAGPRPRARRGCDGVCVSVAIGRTS
jgi:hypothetical protein